jgi:hypothetical protein
MTRQGALTGPVGCSNTLTMWRACYSKIARLSGIVFVLLTRTGGCPDSQRISPDGGWSTPDVSDGYNSLRKGSYLPYATRTAAQVELTVSLLEIDIARTYISKGP